MADPPSAERSLGLRTSVAVVMASKVAGLVAILGVPVVLTRVLSRADFGLYQQFQLLQQSLLIFVIAGFPETLIYFVARQGRSLPGYLAGTLIQLATTLGVAGLVLLLAGPALIDLLADAGLADHRTVLFLAVAGLALGDTLFTAQVAQKKFGTYAVVHVVFSFLQAGLLIVAGWIWRSVESVIWALALGSLAKGAASLAWMGWVIVRTGSVRPTMLREQWSYSLPLAGIQVLKKINGQLHRFFVTSSFSKDAYAVYDIGTKKVPMLTVLRGSVVQVMSPHFAEMEEQKRYRAILSLWHASISRLALVYYGVAAALIAFAPQIIVLLFTEQYRDAVPLFRIFTLLMLGEAMGGIEALLRAFAQNRFILFTTALQFFIALVGSWVGLKYLGLLGPALAGVSASLVGQWVRIARIHGLMGVPFRDLMPWSKLGAVTTSALAAALTGWTAALPFPGPALSLGAGVAAFAVTYVLLSLRLDLIPSRERDILLRPWRRIVGRRA